MQNILLLPKSLLFFAILGLVLKEPLWTLSVIQTEDDPISLDVHSGSPACDDVVCRVIYSFLFLCASALY